MTDLWNSKHDQGIQRVYEGLLDALQAAQSLDKAHEVLQAMRWPLGPNGQNTPSTRVKGALASLALVERAKQIMEKAQK